MFDSSSTNCKTLRVMNNAHTPDTAVLHIKVNFNIICVYISKYLFYKTLFLF